MQENVKGEKQIKAAVWHDLRERAPFFSMGCMDEEKTMGKEA
jgi:hypothetical protein